MNTIAVVRILSGLGLVMALCLTLTGIVAILMSEWVQLAAISIGLLLVLVLSTSLLVLTNKPSRRSTPGDGLAVLILWWLLASLIGAIPFLFDVPRGHVLSLLHESVSCLTTTGHTVIDFKSRGEDWPVSLLVWRGFLHLQGALASLIAAASVFAALNIGGPGIHKSDLFTLPSGNFFDATPRVVIAAASAIGALVVVFTLAMLISGLGFGRSLSDAVSIATTGLVEPGRSARPPAGSIHAVILFVGLLAATMGLVLLIEGRGGRWLLRLRDPEIVAGLGLLALITGVLVLSGHAFGDSMAWAMSSLSTSGVPINSQNFDRTIPLSLLILPTLIGGSALSTAGGLKLARLALLWARAGEEFARLGFRDSVVSITYRGRVLPDAAIVGIWVYLVAYVALYSLLIVLLSASGLSFEGAIGSGAGLLSNNGALVLPEPDDYPAGWHITAMVAMIAGRLEVIALFPAFITGFWRG